MLWWWHLGKQSQSWWCRLLPVSGWLSAYSVRSVAARLQRPRRLRGLRAQGAAKGSPRGAGGARVSGVQRAPRTPAPQCRAGARHARPAPLPRRLTAWPTRPPPPHAATLWRRYESVNARRASREPRIAPTPRPWPFRVFLLASDSVIKACFASEGRSSQKFLTQFDRLQPMGQGASGRRAAR